MTQAMTVGMKRQSKSQKTRSEIMAAALRVFGREGYANTDVSMILAEAGKGRGTFYLYFKDKSEILRDLLKKFQSDLADGGIKEPDHNPEEMPMVLSILWETYRNHSGTFRALFQAAAVDQNFAAIYASIRDLARNDFESMIKRSPSAIFKRPNDIYLGAVALEVMVSNSMYDWLAADADHPMSKADQDAAFRVMVRIMNSVISPPDLV